MTHPARKPLFSGQLGVALAALVNPDPEYDIHVTAILIHSYTGSTRWFEIWMNGLRIAREDIRAGDTLNIIEELGSELIVSPGQNIEGLAQASGEVNCIIIGYRTPK